MKLRANGLNMQLVAELPLSKQVAAITGKTERRATIYQFCDAMTARKMLDYSLISPRICRAASHWWKMKRPRLSGDDGSLIC